MRDGRIVALERLGAKTKRIVEPKPPPAPLPPGVDAEMERALNQAIRQTRA
jgi:hypothetical protein